MKKIICVTLLLSALFFIACGDDSSNNGSASSQTSSNTTASSGGGSASSTSQEADAPVELRLGWWGNPTRDERTYGVIDLYTTAYPNVTIEPETVGWGGYWDRINTQVAAGNLPDIMQHDYAYLLQFAKRNQMADLTPYVENGTINLDGVDESYLSGGRVDGKLYGINLGTNAIAVIYDPVVLADAGVAIPDGSWTMDEFLNTARKVYQETGVQTLPFFTTDPKVGFENWIRQTGQTFFNEDGTAFGFEGTEELEKFFQVQVDLINEGVMVPADEAFVTLTPDEGYLTIGRSWVDYIWSNQFSSTTEAGKRDFNMALFPTISNATRPGTFLKPSMFFSIPATSENKEEAAKFVNFFVNDLEANNILLGERGVPIIDNVRNSVKSQVSEDIQEIFDYISFVGDGNASPIDPPDPAASGEILKMFRDTTQEVLLGLITPSEGAEKVVKQGTAILSR